MYKRQLKKAFRAKYDKAKSLRTAQLHIKKLLKTAQKLGHRGVQHLSKPELHRMIRSGKARPRLGWVDWAKKCQELETNPNPRCHDGAHKKLSISEMRHAILCKSTKQEVCDRASGSGIATAGKGNMSSLRRFSRSWLSIFAFNSKVHPSSLALRPPAKELKDHETVLTCDL